MCPRKRRKTLAIAAMVGSISIVILLCYAVYMYDIRSRPLPENVENSFVRQLVVSTNLDQIKWKSIPKSDGNRPDRWVAYSAQRGFLIEHGCG